MARSLSALPTEQQLHMFARLGLSQSTVAPSCVSANNSQYRGAVPSPYQPHIASPCRPLRVAHLAILMRTDNALDTPRHLSTRFKWIDGERARPRTAIMSYWISHVPCFPPTMGIIIQHPGFKKIDWGCCYFRWL